MEKVARLYPEPSHRRLGQNDAGRRADGGYPESKHGFVFFLTYSLYGVIGQIAEPMPSLREDDEQR